MYRFSTSSLDRLESCDIRLNRLGMGIIKLFNITVLCGARNEEEQEAAFAAGTSKKHWGESKHNHLVKGKPRSLAFDLAPWVHGVGVEWPLISEPKIWYTKKVGRFYLMAGIAKAVADRQGIKIRWGGDWDNDNEIMDNKFDDLGHIELIEEGL